jgi:hypothetical protein
MNMTSILEQALARLQETSDSETAMRPYKAKTPAQMRLRTDPAHRMMREAYKRRTGSDKNKEERYRKAYYRKNKSQLEQRQKRSAQLHHSPTPATSASADAAPVQSNKCISNWVIGNWCYEYKWDDGLIYNIVIYGIRSETDRIARHLGLQNKGTYVGTYPTVEQELKSIQDQLPLAKT